MSTWSNYHLKLSHLRGMHYRQAYAGILELSAGGHINIEC